MSKNDVSITVNSDDPDALVAAATMLLTLAGKVPTIELADAEPMEIKNAINLNGFTAEELEPVVEAPVGNYVPELKQVVNLNGFTAGELEPVVEVPVTSIAEQVMGIPSPVAPPAPAPVAPAPVAPVPVAPASVAPVPTDVQLDADGLPWDRRIHSSGKTINKGDGKWKAKKGIDKAVKETIENELRAVLAAPAPVAPVPVAPAPVAPVPVAPAPVAPAPVAPALVAPAPVAPALVAPAPVAPAPTDETMSYAEFIKGCGNLMSHGKITMPRIFEVLTANGLPEDMTSVRHRADLIPTLWAGIQAKANG